MKLCINANILADNLEIFDWGKPKDEKISWHWIFTTVMTLMLSFSTIYLCLTKLHIELCTSVISHMFSEIRQNLSYPLVSCWVSFSPVLTWVPAPQRRESSSLPSRHCPAPSHSLPSSHIRTVHCTVGWVNLKLQCVVVAKCQKN